MTEPLWKRNIVQRVNDVATAHEKATRRLKRNGGWHDYLPRPRVSPEFVKLLREAARRRNISVGAYVRRATGRQIAKDFGVPWEEVIKHSPYPSTFSTPSQAPKKAPVSDNGKGYGDWNN